ncbi:MAG: DUF5655 domain-containing protein [Anaerolineaceae bacterium]|nr:DUF5655 domain-containing protein [Anaerolineaceae bacterium]
MSRIQLFHATLDGARELKEAPFRKERDLQGFIEFHLDDLFGIEFLDTEHSTGPHDKQRIDSLGIDARGRPVVIEYKLRSDKNIINQGLGYLDWLEKHPEAIELLALKKLGPDKAQRVDLKRPRLLCIAGAFTRNDIVTAENCKASVELVRYCRYGDTSLLLEWVHGGDAVPKVKSEEEARKERQRKAGIKAAETRRQNQEKQQLLGEPDFRIHKRWDKVDKGLRGLFFTLRDLVSGFGDDVQVKPTRHYIGLSRKRSVVRVRFRTSNVGNRDKRLLAYVRLDLSIIEIEGGFTRDVSGLKYVAPDNLEITIRNQADLDRAKPLIERSYEEAG